MAEGAPISRSAIWRNAQVRAVFYQAVVLAGAVGAGFVIFQNTLTNLRQRGISSGFGFLRNEAGFGIAEVVPIPRLEGGFLAFMAAALGGLLVVILLAWVAGRRRRPLWSSGWGMAASLALLLLLPGAVLYVTHGTIRTETYTEQSTYGTALIVGLINTVLVSLVSCVLATVLGLLIGIARLSSNFLVRRFATLYVEVVRNIPLLLQIVFWYFAVIQTLPSVRQSIVVAPNVFLNNRGVYLPRPEAEAGLAPMLLALFLAVIAAMLWTRHARAERDRTGRQLPVVLPALGMLIGLPALSGLVLGAPFTLAHPELRGFNFQGGMVLTPEYTALVLGLSVFHGSYIAEIVRSGIEAVSKGQREAAQALGLRGGHVMRLVILPQALRVIIPPQTSQYLSLTKNSSLGVAIAYPELVSVAGTTLNQSGQAIEVIGITMAVYLTISLLISMGMNWYNARVQLVQR
ncbi:MAG: ABC transporter permease subunit [Candidatus Lambdaproteobacteria bacterium]|nr:ABC transporter permease subunit [Candidatus Lambdaproteobacteria bacterium]